MESGEGGLGHGRVIGVAGASPFVVLAMLPSVVDSPRVADIPWEATLVKLYTSLDHGSDKGLH